MILTPAPSGTGSLGTTLCTNGTPAKQSKSPAEVLLDAKVNNGSVVTVTNFFSLIPPQLQGAFEKLRITAADVDGWKNTHTLMDDSNNSQMNEWSAILDQMNLSKCACQDLLKALHDICDEKITPIDKNKVVVSTLIAGSDSMSLTMLDMDLSFANLVNNNCSGPFNCLLHLDPNVPHRLHLFWDNGLKTQFANGGWQQVP